MWSSADDPRYLSVICAVGPLRGSKLRVSTDTDEVRATFRSAGFVHLSPTTRLFGTANTRGAYAISLVLPNLTFGGVHGVLKQYLLVLAKDTQWLHGDLEILEIANSQISVAISHATILQDLKNQNKELEKARKVAELGLQAREEFLAVVSHEMRTPLHAVMALTSVLIQSRSLCVEDAEMVSTISTSAGLLSVLIDDVLDMSRINRGDFQLRIAPFDLRSLVKEASRMVEPLAKEAGQRLIVEAADLPEWVLGDGKRTMQMCLNLLNNAVKFTKSEIVFKVWETSQRDPLEHQIRVDVMDDGAGIERSHIDSLCERFHQLDTGRKAGGWGSVSPSAGILHASWGVLSGWTAPGSDRARPHLSASAFGAFRGTISSRSSVGLLPCSRSRACPFWSWMTTASTASLLVRCSER